ncbi:glycosyltransferase [Spirosoma montaniterrae]|uniref:Glycosyltransferase n=2 Tax=Spirosoma montaniterrae TaxID=1178516 RepID=A0A1P9X4I6_9BACT|nr:glycosyltransferase [Spirosoma montaniterrae]
MLNHTLIIFVKNPVPGTVKTRIARTAGDEAAVRVYEHLVDYTRQLVASVDCRRVVYYGDFINPDDGWNAYAKHLQTGTDLGERMQNAFSEQFAEETDKLIIIGSDCFEITPQHIEQGFAALDLADIVIGPATDGGYYLLGMKQLHPFLFTDMPWSQPDLRQRTEQVVAQHGLRMARLDELSDIDEWTDYQRYLSGDGTRIKRI